MAVIFVNWGGTADGGGSGHTHSNLGLLNSLRTDSDGKLLVNGSPVGERAIETSCEITLTSQHIADKFLEFPEDCDTERTVTLILENLPQRMGDDWEVIERTSPEKDLVSWAGLGMERIAQAGDRVSLTFSRKNI